jgi:hypothetical protein
VKELRRKNSRLQYNPIPEGEWPQNFTNLRHNLEEKEENWYIKDQNKVDDLTLINYRRHLGATERNKHRVPIISFFLLSNGAVM